MFAKLVNFLAIDTVGLVTHIAGVTTGRWWSADESKGKKMAGQQEKSGEPHGNSEITVTVNYQDQTKAKAFGRGEKVSDVLLWAIDAFSLDDTIATEMELALEGSKDELPGSNPLASLVHGGSALALDLIRGDIANGAF